MANRNWANGGKIFSMRQSPVQIDMSFQVASTEGDGIVSLSSPGGVVQAVFMHCSTTPSADSPNPAAGTIVIQLVNGYNELLDVDFSILQQPNSGSAVKIDNSAMTAGVAYTITTLGTATAAKWHAIGVPAGVTPAVGVSFIAASNGGAGNTLNSRVMTSASAGSAIASMEIVGNPQLSVSPSPSAGQGYGAQIIIQCRDYAAAIAAPADASVISLKLLMSNSQQS